MATRQRRPARTQAGGAALHARLTPAAALRRVVALCLAQIEAGSPGMLHASGLVASARTRNSVPAATGSAEQVHQMRVALRRLRCALRFFDCAAARCLRKRFGDALRGLARVLGAQRNWDVFIADTLPQCGLPPASLRLLRSRAQQQRNAAHERVREHISAPAHARMLCGLATWLAGGAEGGSNGGSHRRSNHTDVQQDPATSPRHKLKPQVRKRLARLQRRVKRGAKRFSALSRSERHALRIEVKRLRYAVEWSGPLFDPKAARCHAGALAALQEMLGHLTDINTARMMLGTLEAADAVPAVVPAAVSPSARQRLRARERELLAAAAPLFASAQAAAGYWKNGKTEKRKKPDKPSSHA